MLMWPSFDRASFWRILRQWPSPLLFSLSVIRGQCHWLGFFCFSKSQSHCSFPSLKLLPNHLDWGFQNSWFLPLTFTDIFYVCFPRWLISRIVYRFHAFNSQVATLFLLSLLPYDLINLRMCFVAKPQGNWALLCTLLPLFLSFIGLWESKLMRWSLVCSVPFMRDHYFCKEDGRYRIGLEKSDCPNTPKMWYQFVLELFGP